LSSISCDATNAKVTPANCQAVAEAVELRLKHGPICYSHLAVLIEDDIFLA